MIADVRVGIPAMGGKGWLGGVSHLELIVRAVTALPAGERPRLYLIVYDQEHYECYQPFAACFDGVLAAKDAGIAISDAIPFNSEEDLFRHIDFYFPVNFDVLPGRCSASWIHDFQHHYLPDLFPERDIRIRDTLCRRIAEKARLVYCTSRAVEEDFRRLFPWSRSITRVVPLRVAPPDSWFGGDPRRVQTAYGLPDAFVLCSNQFWQHKNHRLLFAAIALLRESGHDVHLVCTGATHDFRRPGYYGELERWIGELGIGDRIHVLGLIPRQDQIQLIRRSMFVVQPSLFEGLSLIVQECRALGKPIVLSDLNVHREHEYGITFKRTSERDLAAKMSALLAVLTPGPNHACETEARLQAVGLVETYARQFCGFIEEAREIFSKPADAAQNVLAHGHPPLLATALTMSAPIDNQRRAVESWLELGMDVISVSRPSEIEALRAYFPDVTFLAARAESSRGHSIALGDVTRALESFAPEICGLVEPDTCMFGSGLPELVRREARDGLLYGGRTDIDTVIPGATPLLPSSGFLFFPGKLLPLIHTDEVPFGLPWWDLWTAFSLLSRKVTLKRVLTPLAFRTMRPVEPSPDVWVEYGRAMTRLAHPSFSLSGESVHKFHCIITGVLTKHSRIVEV